MSLQKYKNKNKWKPQPTDINLKNIGIYLQFILKIFLSVLNNET